MPKINNLGQIYWEGSDAAGVSHIYMATPTTVTNRTVRITNTSGNDEDVSMNASGQTRLERLGRPRLRRSIPPPMTRPPAPSPTPSRSPTTAPMITSPGSITWATSFMTATNSATYTCEVYFRSHLTASRLSSPMTASTPSSMTPAGSFMNATRPRSTKPRDLPVQPRHRHDHLYRLRRPCRHQQPGADHLRKLGRQRQRDLDLRSRVLPLPPLSRSPIMLTTDEDNPNQRPRPGDLGPGMMAAAIRFSSGLRASSPR